MALLASISEARFQPVDRNIDRLLLLTHTPAIRSGRLWCHISVTPLYQSLLIFTYYLLFTNTLVEHAYTNIHEQKNKPGVKTYNSVINAQCVI